MHHYQGKYVYQKLNSYLDIVSIVILLNYTTYTTFVGGSDPLIMQYLACNPYQHTIALRHTPTPLSIGLAGSTV